MVKKAVFSRHGACYFIRYTECGLTKAWAGLRKEALMHTKQSDAKELAEVLMKRGSFIFDLTLKERLLIVRHLMPRDSH